MIVLALLASGTALIRLARYLESCDPVHIAAEREAARIQRDSTARISHDQATHNLRALAALDAELKATWAADGDLRALGKRVPKQREGE